MTDHIYDGQADVMFVDRNGEVTKRRLGFELKHSYRYSHDCPLCVFSRKHILQLFKHLDGSYVVPIGTTLIETPPTKTLYYPKASDGGLDWFITMLASNFETTFATAHVQSFIVEDLDSGEYAEHEFIGEH